MAEQSVKAGSETGQEEVGLLDHLVGVAKCAAAGLDVVIGKAAEEGARYGFIGATAGAIVGKASGRGVAPGVLIGAGLGAAVGVVQGAIEGGVQVTRNPPPCGPDQVEHIQPLEPGALLKPGPTPLRHRDQDASLLLKG